MKKNKALILFMALLLILTACGSGEKLGEQDIKLTIPAELSEDFGFIKEEDIKKYAKEVITQDDGSKEVLISKKKQEELLEYLGDEIDTYFKDLSKTESLAYLKDIQTSKDYEDVKIYIDPSIDQEGDFSIIIISMYSSIYRTYAGLDKNIKVDIIDANDNEVLDSFTFPE